MVQVVLILKNRWRISVWFLALLSGGEMCAVIYFRALGAIDIHLQGSCKKLSLSAISNFSTLRRVRMSLLLSSSLLSLLSELGRG